MTRSERLYEFLTSLPDRDFETGREFEEEVIPEFYSTLGYDPENIFYNVTINVGQNADFLDSFAGQSTDSDPWLLVEVRKYTESSYPEKVNGIDPTIYRDLQRYRGISNAEYAVVLTNRAIGIKGPSQQLGYDYHDITVNDCQKIVGMLQPPGKFKPGRESEKLPDADLGSFSTDVFELDIDEYDEYLCAVVEAETPNEKGDRLEEAAEHLIEAVHHFSITDRKLRTVTGEIDLVVENSSHQPAVNCHSRYFLVECKNWDETVGAKALRDFAGKLNSAKCNLGIIFARNGVSGSENENAMGVINDAFKDDGTTIVVFTWRDLLDIREGKSFYQILEQKIFNRRFPT